MMHNSVMIGKVLYFSQINEIRVYIFKEYASKEVVVLIIFILLQLVTAEYKSFVHPTAVCNAEKLSR